ncbi:hypothetical protein ACWGID_00795 [Kribbella sp. NPDC054772]
MKCWVVLCAGIGLLAGCGAKPDTPSIPSAPASSSAVPAPAQSVSAAAPLGLGAYQAELTRIDQVLSEPARKLTRVRTAEGLAEAMSTLAESLNTIDVRLAALSVTSRLSAVHELLKERVGVAALRLTSTEARSEEDARCGGVAFTSQKMQRQLRTDLDAALAQLERLKLTFGATLPDPGPAPASVRPDSGDVLLRRGSNGLGQLKITNGTAKDVAVSIVGDGQPPGQPQVMVYVRAKQSTTVNRIGGAYHLYYKSGADWDLDHQKFQSDCSFTKFDQTFGRNQGWKVNLQPMTGGNADTTEVEAY